MRPTSHRSRQIDDAKKAFMQGFAMAVAQIARGDGSGADEPTMAANLISGYGFTLSDFFEADVDAYDYQVIDALYKSEPSLMRDAYKHLK